VEKPLTKKKKNRPSQNKKGPEPRKCKMSLRPTKRQETKTGVGRALMEEHNEQQLKAKTAGRGSPINTQEKGWQMRVVG